MRDLTQGNVFGHIIKFSIPMLLGNLFQQLYNIVDSLIVGNILGKNSLAAVGASFPVTFILISLVIGFTSGMSVVIAQYYGAKDLKTVKKAIDTLMISVMASGVVIGLIGYIFSEQIFILMRFPEEVIPEAALYFKVVMAGSIFSFGYNGVSAILHGLGDSKTPLYFLMIATILNIALDFVFLLWFRWGIGAVAFATVISQAVAFTGIVLWLNKKHNFVKIRFRNLEFDKDVFKKSIKIGLPSGVQNTIVGLSITILLAIVGTFGTETIAGFTVAIRLDAFAMLPAMTIAIALTSFVGQNIGAGKLDRVKKAYYSSLLLSASIAITIGFILIFWGRFFVGFFTPDIEVQIVGASMLRIMGGFYVFLAAMFMTNSVLRGAGEAMIPMFVTAFILLGIRLPLAYLLSREWSGLGSNGIWWSSPISWMIGFGSSMYFYKKGKWKEKALIRN